MSADADTTKAGFLRGRRASERPRADTAPELPEPLIDYAPPSPIEAVGTHVHNVHQDVRQLRELVHGATEAIWTLQSRLSTMQVTIDALTSSQSGQLMELARRQRVGFFLTNGLIAAAIVVLLLRMYGLIGV